MWWKRGRNCSWSFSFCRFPFKACRIIERLELKEWFCLIALHAGSAHFTERYGVRALERSSPNHSIEQSQNTSNGWWTAQERIKAQRVTAGVHNPFTSHDLNGVHTLPAVTAQSTHRFTPNYIPHIYTCTAQWVFLSQWRMEEKCTERILTETLVSWWCFSAESPGHISYYST